MVVRRLSRPTVILLLLGSVGCNLDFNPAGTAVGNPTDMSGHLAEAKGLTYTSSSARVATLSVATCTGETSVSTVGETIDLLGAVSIPVPAGSWCTFMVEFESPVAVVGTDSRGAPFSLSLAVRTVTVQAATPVVTDGGALILELAANGWLTSHDVDLSGVGGAVDDETRIRLETAIAAGSALYKDLDGDGAVSRTERDEGAVAAGAARDDEYEDADD